MRRVSSRQRLVSWDAFDASIIEETCECVLSDEHAFFEDAQDLPLKRKRTTPDEPPSSPTSLHPSCSFLSAVSTEEGILASCSAAATVVVEDEDTEPNTLTLTRLSEDVQLHLASYLSVPSVRSLSLVNHQCRELLLSDAAKEIIWKEACRRQWPWLPVSTTTDSDNKNMLILYDALGLPTPVSDRHDSTNFSLILQLATSTPDAVDESLFYACRWSRTLRRYMPRHHHHVVQHDAPLKTVIASNGRPAVQFTGSIGQGDRCLRANAPLPKPKMLSMPTASAHCSRGRLLLQRFRHCKKQPFYCPFVAPFLDSQGRRHVTPRLVSYFEVDILEAPATDTTTTTRPTTTTTTTAATTTIHNNGECVAIGLATDAFSLHTRMPGWDPTSFGWHGDDGGLFHASGHLIRSLQKFGVGDTIGCGMDYRERSIFVTLNGKWMAHAFPNLSDDVLRQDWYPVVGLDTHRLVQCNFGTERPFAYDLARHVKQQEEATRALLETARTQEASK